MALCCTAQDALSCLRKCSALKGRKQFQGKVRASDSEKEGESHNGSRNRAGDRQQQIFSSAVVEKLKVTETVQNWEAYWCVVRMPFCILRVHVFLSNIMMSLYGTTQLSQS